LGEIGISSEGIMNPIDIALLFASVCLALVSRTMMKRIALRRLGRANDSLLEIDFWKATSGEALVRCLLFVEILSWLACILLAAMLASYALR
jgi:hypothetical protein